MKYQISRVVIQKGAYQERVTTVLGPKAGKCLAMIRALEMHDAGVAAQKECAEILVRADGADE